MLYHNISQEDIEEFKTMVEDVLIEEFHVNPREAKELIEKSVFAKMLKIDPIYVNHYSEEYWAKDIIKLNEELLCEA